MLLLPSPSKLMLGYLLGAYLTSITLGLVIVFSLANSSTTNTTEDTISPAVDIALGAIALLGAWAVWSGRYERSKAAEPEWSRPARYESRKRAPRPRTWSAQIPG